MADSVTALLYSVARYLDPDQPGWVAFSEEEGGGGVNPEYVEFDMNWTWTPPIPPTPAELEAAAAESDVLDRAGREDIEAFRQ